MSEATFKADGYQIIRNVIPKDTVIKVRSFLELEVDKALLPAWSELGCNSQSEMLSKTKDILEKKSAKTLNDLSDSTKHSITGHFSLETRLSEVLWAIPLSSEFQNVLRTILNSQTLSMHMPPVARFVLPHNIYAGVPPHQDFSYNSHLSDFVTVWIPLVDTDDACGGVTIFKGSGKHAPIPYESGPEEFWLKGIPTFDYQAVHTKMQMGDILVFNKNIIHASRPNNSERIRYSLDCRFFGSQDTSTKHYLNLQTKKVVSPSKE